MLTAVLTLTPIATRQWWRRNTIVYLTSREPEKQAHGKLQNNSISNSYLSIWVL